MNGTSNSTYCPFSGSTTSENSTNQITGELPLEDNERNNVTIMLLYSSGIDVKLNDSIELSEDSFKLYKDANISISLICCRYI